jgi:hypothetical protein
MYSLNQNYVLLRPDSVDVESVVDEDAELLKYT